MKNRPRFTQLALAAGIAAALAIPASIQASPAQQNSDMTATTSLLPEGYTVPNAGILIASTAAREVASGYTMIGTAFDTAAQLGSLDAKNTFNINTGADIQAKALGVNGAQTTASGGFGYGKVDVTVVPGDGRDKGPAPTRITASKNMTNGAANSGFGVIGHQVPFVGENGVTNATADLVSYPARYAHGLELASNTFMSIGNGATAGGGTTNK